MSEQELLSLSSCLPYLGRLTREWGMNLSAVGAYDQNYWHYYDVVEDELKRRKERESLAQDELKPPHEDSAQAGGQLPVAKHFRYKNKLNLEQDVSQYANMVLLHDSLEVSLENLRQNIVLPVDAEGQLEIDVTDYFFERLGDWKTIDTDYTMILEQDGFRIIFLGAEVDWRQWVQDGETVHEGFLAWEFSYLVLW